MSGWNSCEVDAQVVDRLVGQRHDAGLVALAGEGDVPGFGQARGPAGSGR